MLNLAKIVVKARSTSRTAAETVGVTFFQGWHPVSVARGQHVCHGLSAGERIYRFSESRLVCTGHVSDGGIWAPAKSEAILLFERKHGDVASGQPGS